MKKKKKVLKIIVGLIIIVCLFGIVKISNNTNLAVLSMTHYELNRKVVDDFPKYKKDFQVIANKAIKLKKEILKTSSNNFIGVNVDEVLELYNRDTGKIIKLTKNEQHSLENIACIFDGGNFLDMIEFYNNQIIFLADIDPIAIVYSLDGEKPTRIGYDYYDIEKGTELEEYKYKVKNLGGNWYSVSGTARANLLF